jgi:1-acyl-sn-glycerol-3-phosphate acyltransferase
MIAKWLYTTALTAGMATVLLGRQAVRADRDHFHRTTRLWARRLARFWGMEVVAHGAAQIDPAQPAVLMPNHQSHTDIVALIEALPIVPGFLAKKELRRIPFLGPAIEAGGHVFIDRKKRTQAFEAIRSAADQVRDGTSIVVFPEGTRGDLEAIGPFKKGGFHLARQAGVPIIPIGIRGTRRILPKHGRAISAGRVDVHIGAPISAADVERLSMAELMDRVRTEISALAGLPPTEELSAVVQA